MVNLNDVKCKFCGSPAVEFTPKGEVKRAKSEEQFQSENAMRFQPGSRVDDMNNRTNQSDSTGRPVMQN